MLNKEDLEKIKGETKKFFEKTGFELDLEFLLQKGTREEPPILSIKVKMEEPEILIGREGRTLVELQRLLAAVLRKRVAADFFVDLDINDYKEKKIDYLKDLAKTVADRVALARQERVLDPMPAYERRIIHLELAERKDVTTESIGKEPERRVVVRPYP